MEIIVRVVDKLGPLIRNEVELHLNSDEQAATLVSNLKKIQVLLEEAESRLLKDRLVKGWLEELQNVAYDVEDALDDWEVANARLEQQLKAEEEEEHKRIANLSLWEMVCNSPYSSLEKVLEFLHCPCSSFKVVVQHRTIALEVKGLNEKIEKLIEQGVGQLQLNQLLNNADHKLVSANSTNKSGGSSSSNNWRETTSGFSRSDVKGRENDKENLVKMLLSDNGTNYDVDNCTHLEVLCMVGQGGLGKTTLAKMVYDDDKVKNEFPLRMWVCVSDSFEEFAIAKNILEQLGSKSDNIPSSPEALMQRVKGYLGDKKFLLVLDDVWTEDSDKWEQLKPYLSDGLKGSKILVTTRKEKTALAMGAAKCYPLERMDDEECWSIILQTALSEDERRHPGLAKVGRKIAKKCDGSPLAAKVLGGHLKGKRDVQDWQSVLESEIWELKDVEQKLFRHFFLSYDELKPEVKRCFSYCAVFPKDYEIDVEDLIRIWMAQGFLSSSSGVRESNSEMEARGFEYFEDLAKLSFFQDFDRRDTSLGERLFSCKMHDIVHDFAKYLSRNECLTVEEAKRWSGAARHLSCLPAQKLETNNLGTKFSVEKLRSLFCFGSFPTGVDLSRARSLLLDVSNLDEISEEIGNVMHLRYLNLGRNRSILKVPENICNLQYLQTLDLRHSYVSELPHGISKLKNLRHILVNIQCWHFEYTPEIARLTNLRTLDYFGAGKDRSDLSCLRDLNHLRGDTKISLAHMGGDEDVKAAKMAALWQKKFLKGLTLSYDDGVELQVVDALQPNPELKALSIANDRHSAFPSWLATMQNLKCLTLHSNGTMAYSSLPPLWKLPFLELLEIRGDKVIKQYVGNGFYGMVCSAVPSNDAASATNNQVSGDDDEKGTVAFRALKKLTLDGDSYSKVWDEMTAEEEESIRSHNISIMPCLTELIISRYWWLETLPYRTLQKLPSLQTLRLDVSKHFKQNSLISALSPRIAIVIE